MFGNSFFVCLWWLVFVWLNVCVCVFSLMFVCVFVVEGLCVRSDVCLWSDVCMFWRKAFERAV